MNRLEKMFNSGFKWDCSVGNRSKESFRIVSMCQCFRLLIIYGILKIHVVWIEFNLVEFGDRFFLMNFLKIERWKIHSRTLNSLDAAMATCMYSESEFLTVKKPTYLILLETFYFGLILWVEILYLHFDFL